MKLIKVKLVGLEPLSSIIAYELSEFLSGVGALALPRERDVVIDLSEFGEYHLSFTSLVNELKRILERLGMAGDYVIEAGGDTITVRALSSERVAEILEQVKTSAVSPEICPHCGFTTPYPEVMREHIKIHYLL